MTRRLILLLAMAAIAFAQKLPFTAEAMMKVARLSEPALSPDGKQVAFTVQMVDVEKNTKPRQIQLVPLAGGTPIALTSEGNNYRPRWTPDGRRVVYISTKGGSAQIWMMEANGANARALTSLSTEADGVTISPDGQWLLFTSDVYPECGADDACNKAKLDAEEKSKVKARTYTSLLYRHWTEFQGKRRKHLMLMPAKGGTVRDLTPGSHDVPPFSLGGPDDYVFSPDSKEIAYVANPDDNLAFSTNNEIYTIPVEAPAGTSAEPKKLSTSPGYDSSPLYSPDGKYLAWRTQATAGYESDRWRLTVMDRETGKVASLTEGSDRPVQSFAWLPDSSQIFYTIEDRGRQIVLRQDLQGGGAKSVISDKASIDDVQFTPDGKTIVYTAASGSAPAEIFKANGGAAPTPLTRLNEALLSQYALTPLEDFYVTSTDKAKVQSFLVKPPNFDPKKKYPVLFLIHGGPEGAWGESWSYRWNPQVFAAAGFVVVMPNPRGSTGYGQKFTEEIQADWGGKPFDDIMAVADYVAGLSFCDADRMAAAGGSYGGYMIDWMLGHTDRFKALVSHAGVYDLRSMAGETEELWFVNWEFKGMPWDQPELYQKWSPSCYASNFKTPTLVINGELDYRVPAGQGMQLFTALQTQKVPSKFVLYPDEGHWILKPQNSLLWYQTVLDWVGEFTKAKPQ